MNETFLFFLIAAICGGVLNGFSEISQVKHNPSLGVKPSNNIFSFIFTDKY